MKQSIAHVLLGLAVCQAALAGSSRPVSIYQNNYGVVTNTPVVDAVIFLNRGTFQANTVVGFTNFTALSLFNGIGYSAFPYTTKDTLYYTNTTSGLMSGQPGFQFFTATSTSVHSAGTFYNAGTIEGIDTEAFPFLYAGTGSGFVPIYDDSQPIASRLIVQATNIINSGIMTVGGAGALSEVGINVNNAYSTIEAGSVDTGSYAGDPMNATGLQGQEDWEYGGGDYFFVPSPGVYDLYWGVTNGDTVNVENLADELPFGIPFVISGVRGFDYPIFFEGNPNAEYNVTAVSNQIGTNIYYDLVFVNTNFSDPNLSATVGVFQGGEFVQYVPPPGDFDAFENIVQFGEPVFDVVTGQIVTNGVYLIDDGAILPTMSLSLNASVPGTLERPNAFEVTTATPIEWPAAQIEAEEISVPYYSPQNIYSPGVFSENMEPFEISDYGAQIGSNPADTQGSFGSLMELGTLGFEFLSSAVVNLPDPTNQPGRIEITGANVDMTQSVLRAEGIVVLNATNLVGGGTATMDFGVANAALGATNGFLVISNIFPTTFKRVRGDIYAQSATWENTQTNEFGSTNGATNLWHYHVLVVDQSMFGTFPVSVRNLKLTGKSSVVVADNLNVVSQVVIDTPNLDVAGTNYYSQDAQDLTPSSMPELTNLFIAPRGILGTGGILDVGVNLNQGQTSPVGRKYTINSIVNFGQMMSPSPVFQSAFIENTGEITSDDGGSMSLAANVLSLGPTLSNLTSYIDSQTNALGLTLPTGTNMTNFLFADGSVDLSATTIEASNSIIEAGRATMGTLTLDATKLLTDFVSGFPTTNTNSVIINHWSVTGGFSMPVKPALGDLFGTEIHTMTTNHEEATHVWAGTDMGATPAGFVNNVVIGRLVLDRQSAGSFLHFSAAGTSNAMYVDYLELTNYALSNYRSNLLIDPNFKIYFADCDADPEKLMEIYPGLVWVQNFVGPNSTQVVPYYNSSNVCLMNAALAQSTVISFFNGVANYYNQPYVLNNPSDPAETYPCPGDEATVRSLLVTTPTTGGGDALNLLNITINGEGSLSPDLVASEMALGSAHTLTATPARGWVFQDWSTIGLSGPVSAGSRVLPFTFLSNTVITANFILNPFPALQGSYNGLFFETNGVDPRSSGSFTLTLSPSGSFSGRLLMGPSVYSFTSQFTVAGAAQFTAKSGAQSLSVNLQLDMTGLTGQIQGQVSGGSWISGLTANVQPAWTTQNGSPLAGNSYTMVLPMATGSAGTPGGAGFGVGSVNKQGVLSMAGTLADGVTFSVSAPVSQGGQWPFYAYSATGKDSVLGWVSVSNGLICTNVSWSKAAGKGPLYAGGFSTVLQLAGSPWLAPGKQSPALTLANPVVLLSGGNLAQALTEPVALQNFLTYTGANVRLTISSANGSFSGSFMSAGGGGKETISGVVLQNQGRALGFFPGTSESGAVLLESQSQ